MAVERKRFLSTLVAVACLVVVVGCGSGKERARAVPSPTGMEGSARYSLSGTKAKSEFTGPGAAGVCPESADEIVSVVLEMDVPQPRCILVRGWQRLRVTNNLSQTVNARLGGAEIHLPQGSTVTLAESFSEYLEPGGYTMTTDLYGGDTYGVEVRFEAGERPA